MLRIFVVILLLFVVGYVGICALLYVKQRSLLYFPTHYANDTSLRSWDVGSETIGYCREVGRPKAVWLMLHGNGGQASMRGHVLRWIPSTDSFYVLEYPGYGLRAGTPSKASIDTAAREAFTALQARFPNVPVYVVGESLGTGAACFLAGMSRPPAAFLLLVPFDRLSSVAAEKFSWIPVRWLMKDDWDNIESLQHYSGPVKIFGAIEDNVIPFHHAKNLAAHVTQARFQAILGGHGWSDTESTIDFSIP